ncbi:MAG: hypothetical protein HC903_23610 [Methylacidiphilales bacterium]|nr:hypothetical protein [Candidatus Methylacidiphilales bacterium]NJR18149.1 hypothetical protein [Calothrix sp. CSU_2_0]
MKRIIRSNAIETSVTTVNANNLSESLQTMLNQPPSSIAHLLLLSSILFLAMTLAWVWSARIGEVSQIEGELVPIDSEKVQQASTKQKDSQFVLKFDVQNQHLTEVQTKLNQINALMVHTYLADSTSTYKPIKQTKSVLRLTTPKADNPNAIKLDTTNLSFNIPNICSRYRKQHQLYLNFQKTTRLQIVSQQKQATKYKIMNSKTTQLAKVKLVRNYRIADILFDSNKN